MRGVYRLRGGLSLSPFIHSACPHVRDNRVLSPNSSLHQTRDFFLFSKHGFARICHDNFRARFCELVENQWTKSCKTRRIRERERKEYKPKTHETPLQLFNNTALSSVADINYKLACRGGQKEIEIRHKTLPWTVCWMVLNSLMSKRA